MCGTRDSPQIWGTVRLEMNELGSKARELPPSVFWSASVGVTVVVHVGDFLRVGSTDAANCLFDVAKVQCGLWRHLLEPARRWRST